MIVLDSNVISAMIRHPTDDAVLRWLNIQERSVLWTTSITVFELETGLRRLAPGKKQERLQEQINDMILNSFQGRILSLDSDAARASARIVTDLNRRGRSIEFRDAMIAGIVFVHGASLATGNIRHFYDLGIPLANPWDF